METNENLLSTDLQVDVEVQQHLAITAKWAKFLSIIGFIFSGLLFIAGLVTIANYKKYDSNDYGYSSRSEPTNQWISIISVLILAAIWFGTSFYTFRFATKMKAALQSSDQLTFNDSMSNLAKNYKLLGVVTIIYLVLMLVAILLAIFFSSFRRY